MITLRMKVFGLLFGGISILSIIIYFMVLPIASAVVMPMGNGDQQPQPSPVPTLEPCPPSQKLPRNFKQFLDIVRVPGQLSTWDLPNNWKMIANTVLKDKDLTIYITLMGYPDAYTYDRYIVGFNIKTLEKYFGSVKGMADYMKNKNDVYPEETYNRHAGCDHDKVLPPYDELNWTK